MQFPKYELNCDKRTEEPKTTRITMNTKNLGRLQKVELRTAWASESSDFTPWLAKDENLKLLGETVGIDLELEAQEQNVGPCCSFA